MGRKWLMVALLLGGCVRPGPGLPTDADPIADAILPTDAMAAGAADLGAGAPVDAATLDLPAGLDAAVDGIPATASIQGVVSDESGAPLVGEAVLACSATACTIGMSGGGGVFHVGGLRLGQLLVKTPEDTTLTPPHAEGIVPAHLLTPGATVDVGTLWVAFLPAGVAIGPDTGVQTLSAGDGLTLRVRRADLTLPFGVSEWHVAARLLGASHRPAFDVGGEQLLAVYALAPFGATSATPIPVVVALALPAGTPVHFRAVDDVNSVLGPAVAGHADGSNVRTDPGVGIDRLTFLLVSR